jgi:hypothetical protein
VDPVVVARLKLLRVKVSRREQVVMLTNLMVQKKVKKLVTIMAEREIKNLGKLKLKKVILERMQTIQKVMQMLLNHLLRHQVHLLLLIYHLLLLHHQQEMFHLLLLLHQ